jgi:hypothetical protein
MERCRYYWQYIPSGTTTPLHTNLIPFVFVFKALLSDSEEVGRPCIYKYWEPWLGSSLAIAEGKHTVLLFRWCRHHAITFFIKRHDMKGWRWHFEQELPTRILISQSFRNCKWITMQWFIYNFLYYRHTRNILLSVYKLRIIPLSRILTQKKYFIPLHKYFLHPFAYQTSCSCNRVAVRVLEYKHRA